MDERRRSPRYKVAEEVAGRMRATVKVRILDLSLNGMQVEAPVALPPKGSCEITVLAPSGERKLPSTVRRCRAEAVKSDKGVEMVYRAGLEFKNSDEEGFDVSSLISEICTYDGPVEENENEAGEKVVAKEDEASTDSKGFKFAM